MKSLYANCWTIAKALHPGAELVFLFDNSAANHHAKESEGLNFLDVFTLGNNFPQIMRDGWFMRESKVLVEDDDLIWGRGDVYPSCGLRVYNLKVLTPSRPQLHLDD